MANDHPKLDEIVFRETIPLTSWVDQITLVANTPATVTIPSWASYVNFTTILNTFCVRADGSAAAYPAATKTDGTGSIVNPTCRQVNGGTTMSIIADTAGTISMEFFPRSSGG